MVRHSISAALAAAVLCGWAGIAAAQQAPVVVGGDARAVSDAAEDHILWALAERRGTGDAYRNYLATFPNGIHAETARQRLAQAGGSPAPTTPPVVGSPAGDFTGSPADAARAEATASLGDSSSEAALGLSRAERAAIQRRLTQLGHDTRGVDGIFGSGTRNAIAGWQRGRGYPETGYLTRTQADELGRGAPVATPAPAGGTAQAEAALNLNRSDRIDIQQRLNALGHNAGGADGIFGSGTRRAIASWQRSQGLAATGYLDRAQLSALRAGGSVPVSGADNTAEAAARGELALNMSRTDREAVQRRLTQLGHDTRGVDGVFGAGTRRAIADWQRTQGQAATGYLTAGQLRALTGTAPPAPAAGGSGGATAADEARLGLGTSTRAEIQTRLSALGYDTRGIDGVFGSGTRRAISAWQGDNGLAATGWLNASQLDLLRSQRRAGN